MSISLTFLPKTCLNWGIAFLIFRLFDIIKPFPIKNIEKLKGGWGIMTDDVIAGIYTTVLTNVIIRNFELM